MKTPNVYEVIEAEVARLKAENERLRAALSAIVTITKGGQPIDPAGAWMVAEAALKGVYR